MQIWYAPGHFSSGSVLEAAFSGYARMHYNSPRELLIGVTSVQWSGFLLWFSINEAKHTTQSTPKKKKKKKIWQQQQSDKSKADQ